MNPNKFIYSQIDDFLSQKDVCLSNIKVIRTINSITLQQDANEIKDPLPAVTKMEEPENDSNVYEIMMTEALTCTRKGCTKDESNEIDLEIHEFLKHTTFGIQLETEIEGCRVFINQNNETNSLLLCSLCNAQVENNDILLLHFLDDHCTDIIKHINTILAKESVDTNLIIKYLLYMRNCLNGNNEEVSRESLDRNYFNQIYGNTDNDDDDESIDHEDVTAAADDIFEENVQEHMDIDIKDNIVIPTQISLPLPPKVIKREKNSDLTYDDKEWLRREISRGKFSTNLENGSAGVIFRCMIERCSYTSNSSPGLRYHLLIKHLSNRHNLIDDETRAEEFGNYEKSLQIFKNNTTKNCCNECCLKFKDHRSFELHARCHELFTIIAQHTEFPICNTCNLKFLDEKSLNVHLKKHDRGEDLRKAVIVPFGAVRDQGKPYATIGILPGEIEGMEENEFCWKCGHCEQVKSFRSEEYCNFHIIMAHLNCFICPVDRMEFKGFKCVSLYIHHLRNKHSELFPNVSFKCTYCQIELPTIYEKLQHMKKCDSKQFQCDHCDKRFFKKNDLAAHLKVVTGEIIFECE